MAYTVTVARVNEGEHQSDRETYNDVLSVTLEDDGTLRINREEGRGSMFGPTTWGAFQVVRVASAAERLG